MTLSSRQPSGTVISKMVLLDNMFLPNHKAKDKMSEEIAVIKRALMVRDSIKTMETMSVERLMTWMRRFTVKILMEKSLKKKKDGKMKKRVR